MVRQPIGQSICARRKEDDGDKTRRKKGRGNKGEIKKKQMAEEDIREHTNYSIRRVVWINMILIQLSSINTC